MAQENHSSGHESSEAYEFSPAKAFNATHKTTFSKKNQVAGCSVLAAVAVTAAAVAISLGIKCNPISIDVNSASFSVVVSDANTGNETAESVDYVLSLMPGGETVKTGKLASANTTVSFDELKAYRTYMISFYRAAEQGDELIDSYVFTTQKPAPYGSSGPSGKPSSGQTEQEPDIPPEPAVLVEVPDLVGLTLADAEAALEKLGLGRTVVEVENDDYAVGLVCEHEYSGVSVPPQTVIALIVSKGPRVYVEAGKLGISEFTYDCLGKCVDFTVRWSANDAQNAGMKVTVGNKTLASYNAAQTAARLSDGVYVFRADDLLINGALGDDGFKFGSRYTVKFTLSYELNGVKKTSVQQISVRYGGFDLSGTSLEIDRVDDDSTGYLVSVGATLKPRSDSCVTIVINYEAPIEVICRIVDGEERIFDCYGEDDWTIPDDDGGERILLLPAIVDVNNVPSGGICDFYLRVQYRFCSNNPASISDELPGAYPLEYYIGRIELPPRP